MKTIILYYSYSGNSKKQAQKLATETKDALLCEVKAKKRHGMGYIVLVSCPKAMLRSSEAIQKITYDLNEFDRIILVAPVWSGYPVPVFNSIVSLLPQGKEVEIYLCSGGGETPKSKEGTCKQIEKKGCTVTGYHDIATYQPKE